LRKFIIKLKHWEYWPIWVTYLPGAFYFFALALRSRALCFFSAVNPSIESGGMLFQSKKETYSLIPKKYLPPTICFDADVCMKEVNRLIEEANISFPIIVKPDRGERGWLVKIIYNNQDLEQYISTTHLPFIVQTFIDYPIEIGIFYSRHPNEENGTISSITGKDLLKITGDGHSNIRELIKKNDRAYLKLSIIEHQQLADLDSILALGEVKTLVKIGNHSRGTTFLDWNHLNSEKLNNQIDIISKSITGFYYGRFDILCQSLEELADGKNFYVLELNGANAEPAHIYQPGFNFFAAQKVIFWHFQRMHKIAKANHQLGTPYMNFFEFMQLKKKEKAYKKRQSNNNL
jgi:hypothetical protein